MRWISYRTQFMGEVKYVRELSKRHGRLRVMRWATVCADQSAGGPAQSKTQARHYAPSETFGEREGEEFGCGLVLGVDFAIVAQGGGESPPGPGGADFGAEGDGFEGAWLARAAGVIGHLFLVITDAAKFQVRAEDFVDTPFERIGGTHSKTR